MIKKSCETCLHYGRCNDLAPNDFFCWCPMATNPNGIDQHAGAPKNHAQENKPQMSLIPMDLLRDFLEPAYREGLIKYSRESWREGFDITVMADAAQRHFTQFFYDGEDFDPDAEKLGVKKHHLGGLLFAILCMCDTVKNHPEMDNRKARGKIQGSGDNR